MFTTDNAANILKELQSKNVLSAQDKRDYMLVSLYLRDVSPEPIVYATENRSVTQARDEPTNAIDYYIDSFYRAKQRSRHTSDYVADSDAVEALKQVAFEVDKLKQKLIKASDNAKERDIIKNM